MRDDQASPLRPAESVERLAYTRRQAAEALGMSVATLDRRIVPMIETIKMPWGARLIPVRELETLLVEYSEQPRKVNRGLTTPSGRRPSVPTEVVDRIRRERGAGRSLRSIAEALDADGIATGQGGARWWPSTVRFLADHGGD